MYTEFFCKFDFDIDIFLCHVGVAELIYNPYILAHTSCDLSLPSLISSNTSLYGGGERARHA